MCKNYSMNVSDDHLFKSGISALQENKLHDAERIFKILLKTQLMNPELNHFFGITLQLLNKIDAAIISYKTAITLNPKFAEAHKDLGNMLYRLGKISEAEQSYKKALALRPNFAEAITTLSIISEQNKVLSKIQQAKKSKETNKRVLGTRLSSNPFVTIRKVETELIPCLHKMKYVTLDKTPDIRYGVGKCSPDNKLFKSNQSIIKIIEKDLISIMKQSVGSEIHITESFYNIFNSGSGTKPHRHLDPFDKAYGIADQKYSLVYYLNVGDQNCSNPGFLKLYDPEEEILPSEGSIIIIPANRKHSSIYNGKLDRVMIGINFYSLT